ncbi:DUF2321 domain-containing protein [Flavobacterium aquicola]|uniref:DUF2321 domain-containing protein n=1 Tax=Flavobacterium aquicola TaxID=1682742 RepID=A0A3E0E045_9FLAO|nr:DUF2321 domain-containing protein [Flavobacterium aquicola]REG90246.1 hypothetical protein C8P67_1276 [Flavobacterium aquicola]
MRYDDRQSFYDVMQVCVNGHLITDNYYTSPEFRKSFCTSCGEKTITTCPNCNKELKGDYHVPGVVDLSFSRTPVPEICEYCGKDFPWKSKKKKIAESAKSLNPDNIFIINQICERFHLVTKQLRQRYNNRETLDIQDEYDVQNLLHSLLVLYFDDIRPEEWIPSYAGSSKRSDFLLKDENIIIEVKKTRKNLKAKELGEQLIIDIANYKKHPNCKVLYCFVYDPEGYIANPKGIENDLNSNEDKFKVIVKIIPKGH